MAFSKKKVEERKQWLSAFKAGTFLDHDTDAISYSDFVHKELILFSRADLERSIPCMVDGLKPGQRKILFSCFKRNLKSDIKVRAAADIAITAFSWLNVLARALPLCCRPCLDCSSTTTRACVLCPG